MEIEEAYNKLRGYAFYLNKDTPLDAEDLLHDTIVKMIEKIDLYKEEKGKTLSSWGAAIMHNLHVNKLRLKKDFVSEEVLQRIPDIKIEKNNLIKESKLKLTDKKKYLEVFILRKMGLSYDEISKFLDTSFGTTKSRIHHMKQLLCEK